MTDSTTRSSVDAVRPDSTDSEPESEVADTEPAPSRRPWWRRIDPLTAVVLAAIAAYALIGIGSPLLGLKVFAATDLVVGVSPYREAGHAGLVPQNDYLNDTIDGVIPNTTLFATALWNGDFAAWNPYVCGGAVLGAAPNYGLASPLTLPFYLLPAWLAPGYVKLFEIIVAAGGLFLFLRRVRLGRAAALLGGLGFASSGFMVAWTNWPQTRVAAFIPVVFWAVERLVQRRRAGDAALLAVAVASMLLGGFPAVTGYALATAGIYALVRAVAEYRHEWKRLVGVLGGALAGVVTGVLLSAVQLLPFVSSLSGAYVHGRQQSPQDHLASESLITMLAPWAFGSTDPQRPPDWYLSINLVESLSYVGAAILVLLVVAIALPRAGRDLMPRAVFTTLVAATASWVVVIYLGRLPLAVLQQLPVLFSHNYVGRARSVLGMLIAVLAAVGFELLLRRLQAAEPAEKPERRFSWYGVAIWAGAGLAVVVVWWDARLAAVKGNAQREPGDLVDRVRHLDEQVLIGLGFLAAAVAAVAAIWWLGRRAGWVKLAAAALLPALIAVQGLTLALPYWPRADRDTFYPVTDVHRYLAGNLGHDRFAGTGGGMYVGADSAHRLRALTGHAFLNGRYAQVIDGLPGRQFGNPPTYVNFPPSHVIATSPVLDRLGVKYFVVSPGAAGFGTWANAPTDGSTVTVRPGQPHTVPLTYAGPLRGVVVIPERPLPASLPDTTIEVSLRGPDGVELAKSRRVGMGLGPGANFVLPLAAEQVPAGTPLTAVITASAPLTLRAQAGTAAVTTIAPKDDGLRVAYVGSSTVYERTRALPRIRWASSAEVEPDAGRRVARIASGELGDATVLLDRAGAPADGRPAELDVTEDGTDEIAVRVRAQGAGYLVVADALQQDWAVTVDGEPAELVPADHGMVAVALPEGEHTVRLDYRMPYGNAGAWLSAAAAVGLFMVVGVEWWWRRRAGKLTG
ncbi:MAG: YfhO family protein [Micromonosporaceae bacterium]